jgi:hypothetical protein
MTAEMFEQVGPEFAGVGGTSGKKKPGPVPVLQADGTIKI